MLEAATEPMVAADFQTILAALTLLRGNLTGAIHHVGSLKPPGCFPSLSMCGWPSLGRPRSAGLTW